MKKYVIAILITTALLLGETLFQVKDSLDRVVLDVSTDGLRVYNEGDLLMVISASEIKAFIDKNANKALSRSFAVTTSSSKGYTDVLEISKDATLMREGIAGEQYTNFSPRNIFIGLNSGTSMLNGLNNVFVGNNTGVATTYGGRNVFIGESAGLKNTSGQYNVFIGDEAGRENLGTGYPDWEGSRNIFIGNRAGVNNTTGTDNTYIGYLAGRSSGISSENIFIGEYTGYYTGLNGDEANYNVFIGGKAGYENRSGIKNVLIGRHAGYFVWGSGNVMIGNEAGRNMGGNNQLVIANSDTSTPLIKGTFPNADLTFTANRVNVVHPSGTSNGFAIQTSYNNNTDAWHFYQWNAKRLGLFYSGLERGSWNIDTGAYTHISDKRFKTNIESVKPVLEKLTNLQVKEYNFIDQKTSTKYIGLIAQEVEELFPSLVFHNEETDTYQLDYSGFGVLAVKAIQEQQEEIDALKLQVKELMELVKAR